MTILDAILERKRQDVDAARARVTEEELLQAAGGPRRSFREVLSRQISGQVNIIAEIKRASPSRGAIRPDLNPAELARAYARGGAAAISVLTETHYFRAQAGDLGRVREAVDLPILRKDFIVSPWQLYETAAMGADAVLLIARILPAARLRDFLALARELRLDALTEVHSAGELDTALQAGADLIGINNRDLDSFETHLATTLQLAACLPRDRIAVAESGIRNRGDVEAVCQAGIWNFLVGESLLRADDPEKFLGTLRKGPAKTGETP